MAAPATKKKNKKKGSANLHGVSKKSSSTFKNTSNSSNDSTTLPSSLLQDDVPDFPRGGRPTLSRREEREILEEVDAEFQGVKGRRDNRKKNKSHKKKTTANISNSSPTDDDFGSLFGDGCLTGKLPRFANKITLKNVSPGMKIWGIIVEVDEKDLVVSLPGGLRGLVRYRDAFDPVNKDAGSILLSSIFHVGQLVSCVVLQLDDDKREKGKQKIWLSLRLTLLYKDVTLDALQEGMPLTAYVKSVEDHGYILHFGSSSFTGFCPSQSEGREIKVKVGQLLQGVIKSIDSVHKVVHLSSDPDMFSNCMTKDLKGLSINLLVPGMMVNASVRSTLENGIMLSFLTYFTGTVDIFHLQNMFPNADWKDEYPQNKKVNARILFIDPSSRAVALTLNPHLVHNIAPPSHVNLGDIYDHSKVVRVDKELGLLLKIPSLPVPTPAYVSKSNIADKEVQNVDKMFKEGTVLRVRIIGTRHLEGLSVGALKASAIDGSPFMHSDVKPGMVVRAKVIVVDGSGAIVQFPSGVKALCPLPHMSEFEIAKPGKKFKVGAELVFRVLGCKSKRITVTHKKTLVKSKLDILSSYADATEGFITHGWITKIEKHGCFVRFYNGVQGFVPRSELGLELGCEATSIYHVGQVVKCRVTSSLLASRRINLSFIIKPSCISVGDMAKLGSLVSGVVERVTPHTVVVHVKGEDYLKGTISMEHLSDHHGHCALLMTVLKPGYEFDQLLVLEIEGNNLIFSAKYSLIKSAQQIPLDFAQIRRHSTIHGYICNIIDRGCFVRFLGLLTGFCPRNKALNDQSADLSEVFYLGQSVRSYVLDVNSQTSRITLSLKHSSCSSTDASFIQDYFVLEEKMAKLQFPDDDGTEFKWFDRFNIGSTIEGKVHEAKDFGVVISFEKHSDVFGFITNYQCGAIVKVGSTVEAAILDVAKTERLVDLSLKLEFVHKFKEEASKLQSHKKKRRREFEKDLKVNQMVNAVVEVVKENYLVLSLPDFANCLAYASITDYNTQKLPQMHFQNGQSVQATIMALPSPLTAGKLLLLLNCISMDTDTPSSKRAKRKSSYNVGTLVQAEITDIKLLELRLKFGIGLRGRVHITESCDGNVEDPFANYKIGQTVTARIISKANKLDNTKKNFLWELSVKPTMLTDSKETGSSVLNEPFSFTTGQVVAGYVYKVDNEWAWLAVSRHVKARLFILDSACEPSELQEFQKRFSMGKFVSGYVLSIKKEKKLLQLVSRPLLALPNGKLAEDGHHMVDSCIDNSTKENMIHIHEGDVVGGRISKILPGVGGLLVQIGPHFYGKVHFTELLDSWISDPMSGYHEGQFVKCKVLEITNTVKGTVHLELSLRSSLDGMNESDSAKLDNMLFPAKRVEIEDLHPNMVIQGYVKNVTSKGCFIVLSRKLDAMILLSNLSHKFVEKPEEEFPVGKLVTGRVLSVEPLSKRVQVTLKTSNENPGSRSEINDLSNFHVGDIICGRIRKIEPYGLFITIDQTELVGLCHVSALSDTRVVSIESSYTIGEEVKAKILKVDLERQRISLGMKNSYFGNDIDSQMTSDKSQCKTVTENGFTDDVHLLPQNSLSETRSVHIEDMDTESLILAGAESRASICPLEVTFDDIEHSDVNHMCVESEKRINVTVRSDAKNIRKEKRKAKAEREQEIRAAEERLLEHDMPRTADEFEKLVRSSPNSSFVWIKYMQFMLNLADVDKARSIAERALSTINIREESEKFNIWVAYFNLENKYGNPPEEAVISIFKRALQFCDPEKLHLALLGMYENNGQDKLADELLDKMTKKFKSSCTVWLRRIEWFLKQQRSDIQTIVNRALLSLPHHEHINFITRAAILEFKCGVAERGRSMFEGMLREFPKRTDLWKIYLDQEIKLGDQDIIRALFERATSLTISSKKMEPLFKKYLEYEKSLGDEERIESVKNKAMDYVNAH